MTHWHTDALDAPHSQRELDAIPEANPAHIYRGTPFHQADAIAAKDAELAQVTAAQSELVALRAEVAHLRGVGMDLVYAISITRQMGGFSAVAYRAYGLLIDAAKKALA